MLPLSEADPEIKAKVISIIGSCRCREAYKRYWKGHAEDELDPECVFHRYGETVADLVRENRKLRNAQVRIHHQRQLRKAP